MYTDRNFKTKKELKDSLLIPRSEQKVINFSVLAMLNRARVHIIATAAGSITEDLASNDAWTVLDSAADNFACPPQSFGLGPVAYGSRWFFME